MSIDRRIVNGHPRPTSGSNRERVAGLVVVLALLAASHVPQAAELQARTVAAFDRYVRVLEARLDVGSPFLWVDGRPGRGGQAAREALRRGDLIIESDVLTDGGQKIDVPGGLIHHWVGTAFVPGVPLHRVLALLRDYDRHAEIYAPHVARSRLLAQDGESFKVFLRFYQKKVITVIVNSEHEARFTRPADDRAESRIRSTRIAEVDHPNTPGEREKPVGRDGGYMWRLNSYWRLLEADGGTYLQCESVTLSRGIPAGFGWLIKPFVTSIPRESLTFTLETTGRALAADRPPTPLPASTQNR